MKSIRASVRLATPAAFRLVCAVTAFVVAAPAVRAQVVYEDHLLTRDISGITSTGANGSRWITRGAPNAAVLNDNTIQWLFNDLPIIWRDDARSSSLQYAEFISNDSTRRNLYLSTFSGARTRLGVQHATFSNVTFKPEAVVLDTLGTWDNSDKNISWTLENSRIEGEAATPLFDSSSHFTLTTLGAQQSELHFFWADPGKMLSAPTTMVVNNAGGLLFSWMGDPDSRDTYLWSSHDNTYDVNGTTLAIQYSDIKFSGGRTPTVTSGTVTEGFVVRNGGTLSLSKAQSSSGYTSVEIGPGLGLAIVDSTLSLADNAQLKFGGGAVTTFLLTNATVNMGGAGTDTKVWGVVDAVFSGTNVINTASSDADFGFSTGIVLSDSSTVLNINGSGIVVAHGDQAASVFPMNGGTINVSGSSTLQLVDVLEMKTAGSLNLDPGATFVFPARDSLSLPSTMYLKDSGGAPLVVNNNGTMAIEGTLVAGGTIAGTGLLEANGLLKLASGETQFTVAGDLWLQSAGTSQLVLDPTALSTQHLAVSGLKLGDVSGSVVLGAPALSLSVVNDTVVPEGTKFLLVDYDTRNSTVEIFRGLPDGSIFQSGLNLFQILYADPAYGSSAVTLTVVPEPSAAAILVGAVSLGVLMRRRRQPTEPAAGSRSRLFRQRPAHRGKE